MTTMKRRTFLGAGLLLAAPALGQTPPAAAPLSAADQSDIARVEAYFNGLRSLKARFRQFAQNGAVAEGDAWIVRPGRMRFEYDPPEPLLLVANSGQFFYFDRQLKQATVLPVGSTPLGLLLRENLRLAGDVTVGGVAREGGALRINLFKTGAAGEGRLTLGFSDNPLALREWELVDAQGRLTKVQLSRIELGARYPDLLFTFNDPRFREQLGIQ